MSSLFNLITCPRDGFSNTILTRKIIAAATTANGAS
jgi:hypothetical protein